MLRSLKTAMLDALRKQRNLADYDGDLVTDDALQECIRRAMALLALVEQRVAAA